MDAILRNQPLILRGFWANMTLPHEWSGNDLSRLDPKTLPGVVSRLAWPPVLCQFLGTNASWHPALSISRGSGSPVVSSEDSLLIQLRGRTMVDLMPFDETAFEQLGFAQAAVAEPSSRAAGGFVWRVHAPLADAGGRWQTVTLEVGDALLTPAWWIHRAQHDGTRSLQFSISLSGFAASDWTVAPLGSGDARCRLMERFCARRHAAAAAGGRWTRQVAQASRCRSRASASVSFALSSTARQATCEKRAAEGKLRLQGGASSHGAPPADEGSRLDASSELEGPDEGLGLTLVSDDGSAQSLQEAHAREAAAANVVDVCRWPFAEAASAEGDGGGRLSTALLNETVLAGVRLWRRGMGALWGATVFLDILEGPDETIPFGSFLESCALKVERNLSALPAECLTLVDVEVPTRLHWGYTLTSVGAFDERGDEPAVSEAAIDDATAAARCLSRAALMAAVLLRRERATGGSECSAARNGGDRGRGDGTSSVGGDSVGGSSADGSVLDLVLTTAVRALGDFGWLHPDWPRWPRLFPLAGLLQAAAMPYVSDSEPSPRGRQMLATLGAAGARFVGAVGAHLNAPVARGGLGDERDTQQQEALDAQLRRLSAQTSNPASAIHTEVSLVRMHSLFLHGDGAQYASDGNVSTAVEARKLLLALGAQLDRIEATPDFNLTATDAHGRGWRGWHAFVYRHAVGMYAPLALWGVPAEERDAYHVAARLAEAEHRGALLHRDQAVLGAHFLRSPGYQTSQPLFRGDEHAAIGIARRELSSFGTRKLLDALDALRRRHPEVCNLGEKIIYNADEGGEWGECHVVQASLVIWELRASSRPDGSGKLDELLALLRRIHLTVPVTNAKFFRLRGGTRVGFHSGGDNLRVRHLLTLKDGCKSSSVTLTGSASAYGAAGVDGAGGEDVVGARSCARMRVGLQGEWADFVEGHVISFDDSFLHKVENSGPPDQFREVLMVETLNPLVSRLRFTFTRARRCRVAPRGRILGTRRGYIS